VHKIGRSLFVMSSETIKTKRHVAPSVAGTLRPPILRIKRASERAAFVNHVTVSKMSLEVWPGTSISAPLSA
jgi:hypothetical protein